MNSVKNKVPLLHSDTFWAILLLLPVLIYYWAHYHTQTEFIGSGFVAGDMASYMANARQHFDEGGFHFFYANPFNLDNSGPKIYFQIQTLFLALVWKFTGMDVGTVFMLFGFVFSFLAILFALKSFKKLFGWNTYAHYLTFILLIYGGGVLIMSGFAYQIFMGKDFGSAALDCLVFDPGGGFWMLNLGRNFVYPTEAYYHFLTMLILYAVVSKKQGLLSLTLFVLAFSHPFYGIQFLLITLSWQFFEFVFGKQKKHLRFLIINSLILLLFLAYNFIYLQSFPEHRIIIEQWSLNWNLPLISSILAYGPLLIILFVFYSKSDRLKTKFQSPENRFLLAYFLISLVLANHELFIKPVQPIHFTHGHIYIPLFLLTAPVLIAIFQKRGNILMHILKIGIFGLLIFDNLSWYPAQYYNSMYSNRGARLHLTAPQKDVIAFIDKHYSNQYLLFSEDSFLDYLATTYTPVYALIPHGHNTPFVDERKNDYRQFFLNKNYSLFPDKKLLVIDDLNNKNIPDDYKTKPNFVEIYRNKQYVLYERKTITNE